MIARHPLRRRWTAAVGLGLVLCAGVAGQAWAQQRAPRIWDIPFGTHVRELPAKEFVDPACGTNGGPAGRPLGNFENFALCPVEEATGLREVWFIYDDTLEYVGLARREPALYPATSILLQPVILSFLVGDEGRVEGYRIFTDPRTPEELRLEAHTLSRPFKARMGGAGWQCADLPGEEGENPLLGLFVKQRCEKNAGGVHARVEARHYYKPGQTRIDPFNNRRTVNEFESSARVEVIQVDPLPPLAPDAGPNRGNAPAEYSDPRAAFLAGASNDCAGCDLFEADLRRRDLSGANLEGANLEGAILHRAVLREANLTGANLFGANLNRADLTFATLRDADLSHAMLYQTDAARADFSGAILFYASMGRARLILAVFEGANLDYVDVGQARMNDANLANASLNGAYAEAAVLFRADLRGVVAENVFLAEADLRRANLGGANVRGADLKGADLAEADLSNADFSGALLQAANLHDANRAGTIFTGAIMPDNSIGR